ncbi:MAG TPA: DUF5671 domain-containing protein [Acidimicrobiales bacterium]|jgi:hypothetical protein|nr:DUF5671 domain-containing protein [Acidimicrobiales bacterium]
MVTGQLVNIAGGAAAGVAVALALFSGVFIVLVILIVANRAEPDPRGMRPHTVYLFGMSFVMLQLTFAGSVLIMTALFSLIAPHYSPMGNSVTREVVIGALFVVIAGSVWVLHFRRGIATATGDSGPSQPNSRVMNSYAGVVGFIYLLQLVFSFGVAVYLLLALIAPGVFGSIGSSRNGTLALLLDLVYIMVASAIVLMIHANLGPSVFPPRPARPVGMWSSPATPAAPVAPPAAPSASL